jgi:hypothetical protein
MSISSQSTPAQGANDIKAFNNLVEATRANAAATLAAAVVASKSDISDQTVIATYRRIYSQMFGLQF